MLFGTDHRPRSPQTDYHLQNEVKEVSIVFEDGAQPLVAAVFVVLSTRLEEGFGWGEIPRPLAL